MCNKKNEQRIPKTIARAGDACPAGLGSGKQNTIIGVQDYVLGFCSFAQSGSSTETAHNASLPAAFLLSSPESYGMSTGEARDR